MSLVVLVGGGVLCWAQPELTAGVFGFIGSVIGFWFGKRGNGHGNGNGHGQGNGKGGTR